MKASSFFDRPAKAVFWFIAAVSVIWSVQCTAFQSVLGKDILETVTWGAQWQLGHLKHPPLSGWIGYLIAAATGYSDFAMYFAAQLFLAIGAFYVYKLAREFLNETESAASVLLLYVLFYYNPSSMKFCSHFLEAAFMPAMAYYIVRGAKHDRIADWLLAGVFTALAILGKYSGAVILPVCLVYILWDRERRKCFLKPGVWLGMALCAVLLLPHLIWLARHDFCCLLHVRRRITDDQMPWYYFLEIAAVGIAPIAVSLLALLLSWLPCRKEGTRKPSPRKPEVRDILVLSMLLSVIPVVLLTLIALSGGDVVMMWLSFLASWFGIWAVAWFPWEITRSHFRNLWLLAVLYTLIALIATTVDIAGKTRLRCHADTGRIVKVVEEYCRKQVPGGKVPMVIGERWLAGVVQFYSPSHPLSFDGDDPVSLAPFRERIGREGALLIGDQEDLQKWLPEMAGAVKFEYLPVQCKARFGKTKYYDYVIAFYPGKTGK